jgi:gamma-glutamyltranspeptidase/glutathione hydrolase
MHTIRISLLAALVVTFLCAGLLQAEPATSERDMVATVNPLATQSGVNAFEAGGNAIDAAVAAALTLGVVDGHNSGIGGGCFILLRRADGKLFCIDGREVAPAAATRDMYVVDGELRPSLSKTGPLACGVPGAVAALDLAVREYGRLKFSELLLPAAEIAERGFAVDRLYASRLKSTAPALAKLPAVRAIFLKDDGAPYAAGEVLKQPDLALTYRMIAKEGPEWFYRGAFADQLAAWMKLDGGLITAKDMADYRPVVREPVVTKYRDYEIVGFPPPSSGGVHVAQILGILEHFDLKAIHDRDPSEFVHITAEAMKLAFADRAHWLGDPAFARVPRGLVDREYARTLAAHIDPDKVIAVPRHGEPPAWRANVFGKHTTHIAAADAEGNWVAITCTINTSFGSKCVVPGTGVLMNNQMDDFSIQPGVPNAFGLVGAEANAVAPGKRPLSSMSPTILLKDGRPVMTVGAAGGPRIISQVVLAIVNHVDLGLLLDEAVAAKRHHHQWKPDVLLLEKGFDPQIAKGLERRGHKLDYSSYLGTTQAIGTSEKSFIGIHDPRVPGAAAGR